ncbi:MAG: acyl-ACP--UDP-N-acetylglucosamine O-acyltransferase [Planctomycetota bacterium]|nr:acyl-ACP--UDP-N-acetylglucosamine O-acyltransferase [Planctomycetota bacterium]MDA1179479.1 acyl-ACP--UDP-N-acetylglucosamine O-acyltransferase [Planctomycetota bacterium]
MSHIHPTAILSPEVEIGENVEIGPYCVLEGEVRVAEKCVIGSHVVLRGRTGIGSGTQIFNGASLGNCPQHARLAGPTGGLVIGRNNVIREFVTIHGAMSPDHDTIIGQGNYLMAGSHVAHDCCLGDQVIMANNALLAGHVEVGNSCFVSGAAAVHQHCRIGAYAMIGGQAHVTQDVLPYVTVDGRTSQIVGLNIIGLRRNGFTPGEISTLKDAYRVVFRSGNRADEILRQLQSSFPEGPAAIWANFIQASHRGFVRERAVPAAATLRIYQPDNENPEAMPGARRAA